MKQGLDGSQLETQVGPLGNKLSVSLVAGDYHYSCHECLSLSTEVKGDLLQKAGS